jgi:hypothetical protein
MNKEWNMSHPIQKTFLAALGMVAAGAAMADVTVNYIDADHYTDLPRQAVPRKEALDEFSARFRKLGAALAPDQDLVVDVLDIDLAGRARPGPYPGDDLRVLSNGVGQSPHVVLRYTLSEHGKVIDSRTVNLTDRVDPAELHAYPAGLRYAREMRMIDAWWHSTVQPLAMAQR